MINRILVHCALFFSILFLPWWVFFVFAVGSLLLIRPFYEVIFWGFFADMLYGGGTGSFHGVPMLFSMSSVFLCALSHYAKEEIRLYQ